MSNPPPPPKTVMQAFLWALYATIVLGILYLSEEIGKIYQWNFAGWSWFKLFFVIAVITVSGLGLFLGMKYLIDAWGIRWNARQEKRKLDAEKYSKTVKKEEPPA